MPSLSPEATLRALKFTCWATLVLGLLSSLATFPATERPWILLFDILTWPIDGSPATFERDARALSAVLGGVMVGWMAMFLYLLEQSSSPSLETMNAILVSLLTWFVTDSFFSAFILPGNIALNTATLAIFLPLVLKLRAHAKTQDRL